MKSIHYLKIESISVLTNSFLHYVMSSNSHGRSRGGYSHTLPIRVCAAQRGRDFEAPGLERGIHFRRGF